VSRIRTVKPEFWTDGDMLKLTRDARLFYIGLWNFSDDNGVMEYDTISIKSRIFPNDKINVQKLLDELLTIKKISIYKHEGREYFQIKSLKNHQIIDRPRKSHLPLPDPCQLKSVEISPIRKEGSKDVMEGKEGSKKNTRKEHPRLFSFLIEQYPDKQGRSKARERFNEQIRTKKDWYDICKALKNYKARLAANDWLHPQHAEVWFNGRAKGPGKGWRSFIEDYIDPATMIQKERKEKIKATTWSK
jgi:hypothetical protein